MLPNRSVTERSMMLASEAEDGDLEACALDVAEEHIFGLEEFLGLWVALGRCDWVAVCSEARIIFSIHKYNAILMKFEYFMIISLISLNF
jgi:hypothetical protein